MRTSLARHAIRLAGFAGIAMGLATVAGAAPAAARAKVIVAAEIASTDERQPLNGTKVGLATNLPGGNWTWGGGWDWGAPFVSANWDPPGIPANIASLAEEKTALAVSIASTGAYVKPAKFTISATFSVTGDKGGGLGFWSAMEPVGTNDAATTSFTHFTGLLVQGDGHLAVYEDGAAGTTVEVTVVPDTQYTLSYDVDTATGAIANIQFDGKAVKGLSSTAFTNAATAYAGLMSGDGGRTAFTRFSVTTGAATP